MYACDKLSQHEITKPTGNACFAVTCAHDPLEADLCNVASGWEKGVVEKSPQDSRQRIWLDAQSREWGGVEEINTWLGERFELTNFHTRGAGASMAGEHDGNGAKPGMIGSMHPLTLSALNDNVCRVLTSSGEHVGHLKLIAGAWKFKAIGYDAQGDIVPGGGPLTHQHNMVFSAMDEADVSARLLAP